MYKLLFWEANALSLLVTVHTYIYIMCTVHHAYTTNVRVLLVIKDSQKGKKELCYKPVEFLTETKK